jgi:hypothetical protein
MNTLPNKKYTLKSYMLDFTLIRRIYHIKSLSIQTMGI